MSILARKNPSDAKGRDPRGDQSGSGENVKYPGIRAAVDGNTAVILCERESTDAAGAYPITPSTQQESSGASHM